MPEFLLLLWLGSTLLLWGYAIQGLREASAEANEDRRATGITVLLLAAGPPTLVFVVSAFVLLQAAPTVQFNAGSSRAMNLWSFWVHWWPTIFGCSGLQTVGYFLWLIGSLVTRARVVVRYVVALAFLSSVFGSLLLSMAFPSA